MEIKVADFVVHIEKKNIKNLHLYVKPPNGYVTISAPNAMDDSAIEAFVRIKTNWIRQQIEKFNNQLRLSERQYVSGETMYIWGKQYFLIFQPNNKRNSFQIKGKEIILSMRKESTVEQRQNYVREQYRSLLKEEIDKLLPRWEMITGLKCLSWQTKYMITKWGTCNTDKKKLWFNLQLVHKPVECLEYIILHELTHLQERTHGEKFVSIMDKYMPHWRESKKLLNDQRLDHFDME